MRLLTKTVVFYSQIASDIIPLNVVDAFPISPLYPVRTFSVASLQRRYFIGRIYGPDTDRVKCRWGITDRE